MTQSLRIGMTAAALVAFGMGCQSQSTSIPVSQSLSPLASPSTQWMVGTWLQSANGIGSGATAPNRHGRMQFQVNPPLFQWEGFRTVGVEGDSTLPGPMDCRLRQISQHFSLKPSTTDKSAPGAQTLSYFIDALALIPDPGNNALCAAYVARKQTEMSAIRESYFFDLYQDANGQLVDTLRQASFAHFTPAKTSDGCVAINGLYADSGDTALGGTTGRLYLWAQSSCNQVTITQQTLTQEYDSDTGASQISAITSGTPTICGQGGDGSCEIGSTSPLALVTRSDMTSDPLHTTTTEKVEVDSFGDLSVTLVVQDDAGTPISSTTRMKFLQDTPTPTQK